MRGSLIGPLLQALSGVTPALEPESGAEKTRRSVRWATTGIGEPGSLVGAAQVALPYMLAGGQLSRPIDALFEGMSGFTTTGATVARDVATLPVSIQEWRQQTIWMGGLGVVVLGLGVLPLLRVGGRQLLENELAGPGLDTISGRIRDTARRFASLFVGLSIAGFLALAIPGWLGVSDVMDTYQAFAHTLSTIGTGSFSTEPRSIGGFGAVTQWTIVAFMMIAGANFLVLHRALIQRRPREALRDEELRLYLAILLVAAAIVTGGALGQRDPTRRGRDPRRDVRSHIGRHHDRLLHRRLRPMAAVRTARGCAAVFRRKLRRVDRRLDQGLPPPHPRPAAGPRDRPHRTPRTGPPDPLQRRRRRPASTAAVISFVLIYIAVFVLGTAVLALDAAFHTRTRMGTLALIYASASTLANAGVGLGAAGARGSFAVFGDASKLTITFLMWIGRLEIVPVVVLLRASYWRV